MNRAKRHPYNSNSDITLKIEETDVSNPPSNGPNCNQENDFYRQHTPVILRLSACGLDGHCQHLYICHPTVLLQASQIQTLHFAVLAGTVKQYLHLSNDFYCIWHLQKHDTVFHVLNNQPKNPVDKVWFAVPASLKSAVDSLFTTQLKYFVASTLFKRDMGSMDHSSSVSEMCQFEEVLVDIIAQDSNEFQLMCPAFTSSNLTLSSILTNATNFVEEIHINLNLSLMAERRASLIGSVLKYLLSLYTGNMIHGQISLNDVASLSPERVDPDQLTSTQSVISQAVITHERDDSIQVDDLSCKLEDDIKVLPEDTDQIVSEPIHRRREVPSAPALPSAGAQSVRFQTERFQLVQCPLCGMIFRRSRNRLHTLISHIQRRHRSQKEMLTKLVTHRYNYCLDGTQHNFQSDFAQI